VLTLTCAGDYTIDMKPGATNTSDRIVVNSTGNVTLNLNGVNITAPNGDTGADALTVTSGALTLNIVADCTLTGGFGSGFDSIDNGGNGIAGNVAISGTAKLTASGQQSGHGETAGSGIAGNATVSGRVQLEAVGGLGGSGTAGGSGIKGNVVVSGTATVTATGNNGFGGCSAAITGTITAEGHTIKGGTDESNITNAITSGAASNDQYVAVALPTAAEYAAASPAAASGTDYVVDDTATPKTLHIKTAKGAAFWSSSGNSYLDYAIYLDNDIDVSDFLWSPAGTFAGIFDGQGHSITGLTASAASFAGLFSHAYGATIKNLCLSGSVQISNSVDGSYGGALVAYAVECTIVNCCSHTDVTATSSGTASTACAGGLVGIADSETAITNCFNTGSIRATVSGVAGSYAYAGGIAGYNYDDDVNIINCYSIGSVTAANASDNYAGGVIGYISGTVNNCYYLNSAADKGIGGTPGSTPTITGCGTFDSSGTLTAGTADQFVTAQTLESYADTLLNALGGWVKAQASADYYTWASDNATTPINSGYPVFGPAWVAQAQWGAATGTNNDQPPAAGTWVHSGSLTDAMTYANSLASGTAYIQLLTDVDITATLEFAAGKATVLDLNGKTLDGEDIPTSSSDNNVLIVSGSLTLCDSSTAAVANQGKITNGHGSGDGVGGGIYVDDSGNFIMTGGKITDNTATTGGGVANEGTFTITGGSITGNTATNGSAGPGMGGGVANLGSFNMSGGSITDNTSVSGGSGGGIANFGTLTLSGSVNISGNTVGTASDNVALIYGAALSITAPSKLNISDALTNSTAIGVSVQEVTPDAEDDDIFVFTPKAGVFTDGSNNSDYISKFVSDNSDFAVIADGGQLKLAAAQAITRAAATNGSFTVKVNGNEVPSAIEGQTVTITPTANSGYELDMISVYKTGETGTTVTVSSSNTFTMPAYAVTVSVTFIPTASSGDSGDSGWGTTTPGNGAPVIVDGNTVNIGTENTSGESTTVTVNQTMLGENISGASDGSSVVVPVSENGRATASLVVQNIDDMAAKGMTLTVQTGNVAYNLNTSAIDTTALASAFPSADMSHVPFDVTIQNSSATVKDETLVLSPVEFTVTATYNGRTVSVDTFGAYIDRVIEVTAEQAAKITTAVVVNADGSVRHVPTNVIEKDGKYYAIINSRTNSTYALISNETAFSDAQGKWYENIAAEMASRKIVNGKSETSFDGDASISRAEFVAILVRALGLPTGCESSFVDVHASDWYCGLVGTAAEYGLVNGYSDGSFKPNANITREEAMAMVQRAAKVAEYTGTAGGLDSFADSDEVSAWAKSAAEFNVGSGLIVGSDGELRPNADISRAETATVILRLLQKAELVDVRSRT